MFARFVVAALGALVLSGTVAQASIITTATYNNHTYHLITAQSWPSAQAEALSLGGNLVTINDAAENAFVANTFTPTYGTVWIGFNDVATEGSFEWVSGQPVTFTNWAPFEPNNLGNEDFTHLNGPAGPFGGLGTWNDLDGNVQFNAVVEVVPEPASMALFGVGVVALAVVRRRRRA